MIKTKEFIEKVKKLGFTIEYFKNPFSNIKSNCAYDLITISVNNQVLVKVWTNCQYAISTISDGHSNYLDGYDVDELYKLCFEYACTPVEDREDEKEFYLKHKWIKGCAIMYLYRNELNGYCYLGENKCRPHKQRRFTLEEIKELKEKFNTDLSDFELVEVEDDY